MSTAFAQGLHTRLVHDGGLDLEKLEQPLARDHSRLYGPVECAEEVERSLQLVEVRHEQDEITNGPGAARDLIPAGQQGDEQAAHEHDRLAHVHVVDAICDLGLGRLEPVDGLAIAVELPPLGVEVLDGLVRHDRVVLDGLLLAVCVDHFAALVSPSGSHADGQVEVVEGDDRDEEGVHGAKSDVEVDDGHQEIHQHRHHLERDLLEELVDRRALVKCREDLASPFPQVEVQRERVDMFESSRRQSPVGVLGHGDPENRPDGSQQTGGALQ